MKWINKHGILHKETHTQHVNVKLIIIKHAILYIIIGKKVYINYLNFVNEGEMQITGLLIYQCNSFYNKCKYKNNTYIYIYFLPANFDVLSDICMLRTQLKIYQFNNFCFFYTMKVYTILYVIYRNEFRQCEWKTDLWEIIMD